ncbi:MAG: beta-ketoacyl-ACP synthase III [Chloroflexota bacterium]
MASKNGQHASVEMDGSEQFIRSNGSNGAVPYTNGNGSHTNGATAPTNGSRPKERPQLRGWRATGLLRFAHVVGWGMKVPDGVLTNFDLEAIVDTTDEWIRKGTGIRERRIASERESVVTLGFEAARLALARADVLPSELELIIVATSTPEDVYPSSASKIQNLLGATRAGAFDLSAACSGFVYALNMAVQAIRSGSIDTAIVIGSEVNTRVLDWSDRSTCILFGDGAGAIVLQGRDTPGGMLSCILGSDGSGAELLGIPSIGRAVQPDSHLLNKIHMNGREVFRFATHIMNESIKEAVAKAGLSLLDIALIVPHQANQRIIHAAARDLKVPESLFYSNIERYGNTSAASIPIALCEAEHDKRIKPNDNIVLVGFGGGLTWGAAVIQWQVVPQKAPQGLAFRLSESRREAEYILAFWRGRFMTRYRRIEALIAGSPTKVDGKNGKTGKGDKSDKTDKGRDWRNPEGTPPERVAERDRDKTLP